MAIRIAQSPGGRIALGFAIAAVCQFLSLLLAGAGHGWVTPFFLSMPLWIAVPATFYLTRRRGRGPTIILAAIILTAVGLDALLVRGTLHEQETLLALIRVNGFLGGFFVGLWLALWFTWQAVAAHGLLRAPADRANA